MDDHRDIVAAGFAILCAALMLVAWLLWISDKPEHGNSDFRIEHDLIDTTSKRVSSGLLLSKPYSSRELSAKLESMLRAQRIPSPVMVAGSEKSADAEK